MITRDNYQAYAVDYLEGSLDQASLEEFTRFLSENPDIQDEIMNLQEDWGVELSAHVIELSNKSSLHKKSPIHEGNEDEYLVASLEKTLSLEDEKFLSLHVQEYKEARDKKRRYAQTILKPDFSLQYPQKSTLKKSIVLFYAQRVWPYAAAACIVLFLGLGYFKNATIQEPMANLSASAKIESKPLLVNPVHKNPIDISSSKESNPRTVVEKTQIKKVSPKKTNLQDKVSYEQTTASLSKDPAFPAVDKINVLEAKHLNVAQAEIQKPKEVRLPNVYHINQEETITGLAFAKRFIDQKTDDLLKKRQKNETEKQSNVWAWIQKKTGLRVYETLEQSPTGVEIAMGNRISITSK